MKRYREVRVKAGGITGGGVAHEVRVVELPNATDPPEGAVEVDAKTPLHDWRLDDGQTPAEES